jgi:hypothetical protein
MTTNTPRVAFTQTGLSLPYEADILQGVLRDTNAAFGGNLNINNLETPQGQLASSTAAIIGDANDTFAQFVNQINPDFADGFMQDAIARIYFLNRKAAIPTSVSCDCLGLAGTVIPLGARAQDGAGNQYLCTQAGTITSTGTVSLPFICATSGAIECPANSVNAIAQGIVGWDKVNNPAAGAVGAPVESRADFAYRRQNSVALNAHGSLNSIYAAVFNVSNVLDVYVTENVTNASINVGATNYPLAPHSLYVAVVGGAPAEIAQAIWSKKDVGCDYNGNTSATVIDPSGYAYPQPSYTVKYQTPANVPIFFNVQIETMPNLPNDIVSRVKAAIVAAFNGTDGGKRARIGSMLLASRYYAPIVNAATGVQILNVKIGLSAAANLDVLNMGIDQFPTVSAANINVTLV